MAGQNCFNLLCSRGAEVYNAFISKYGHSLPRSTAIWAAAVRCVRLKGINRQSEEDQVHELGAAHWH